MVRVGRCCLSKCRDVYMKQQKSNNCVLMQSQSALYEPLHVAKDQNKQKLHCDAERRTTSWGTVSAHSCGVGVVEVFPS